MTIISIKETYSIAKTIKEYVEKNKKFPLKITVNNKNFSYGQCAYILSYAINYPTKDITLVTSQNASNPTGVAISENIEPADYKNQAKRVAQYIKTNGRCPNYVTTLKSKKKVKPSVFIYAFAKIIVWYNTHSKTLPNYCTYSSSIYSSSTTKTTVKKTNANKLNAYMTSKGCSGMGQCTGYYCGCNSLQQCFYRLTGIKVPESTIASVAGTTTSGTDHAGLNTAVAWFNKKYNKNIKITWKNFSDLGKTDTEKWAVLQSYINKGAVFCHIKYRNQWGHYEVPKQVSGSNIIVLNSLGDKCNSPAYCGYIETRSKSDHKSYINGVDQKSIAILTKG